MNLLIMLTDKTDNISLKPYSQKMPKFIFYPNASLLFKKVGVYAGDRWSNMHVPM